MSLRQIVKDSPMPSWVPLDRAISLAQSQLGMDGDEYRHLMREEAKVAMDKLGLFYIAKKSETIKASAGGRFRKPCDYMSPLSLQLRGLDGSAQFPSGCVTPTFDPWVDGCTTCDNVSHRGTCATVNVTELKDYFEVRPKPTTGYLDLIYYAYPSDEDGRMLVPLYAYLAVSNYCEWQGLKRRQRREGYRMVPNSMVLSAKAEWNENAREAKGRKNTPNPAEMPGVAATWAVMSPSIRGLMQHRIKPLLNNI